MTRPWGTRRDESLILTAVDLSGRSYLGYGLEIPTEKVGTFDTELAEEFFLGFVRNARCTLHIRQMSGSNSHHILEGTFKSVARALREAVFNAMVHRDYGFSGSTLVSLYEDRLEILSLGGLAEGGTYQDMMMGVSIQRNPKLAEVFFRLHYIEAFGTGVHRILRAYEGCARQPEFLVSDNAVKVILPNIHYEEDVPAVDNVKEPGVVYESLARNADDIRVCEAIANGVDSRRALQETMGFSLTKTVNILRRLQDEMKIVRLGKGKNSRYSVRN